MNSKHIETPTKAKIQGAVEFCEKQGIYYHKEDGFRTFGVERTRGYAYLREGASHHVVIIIIPMFLKLVGVTKLLRLN